jgi:CheY-like chemotaxis protein
MAPRILYVEDNWDNLNLVKRVLQAEGMEFLAALSAQEGIDMAEQHRPDLILMDINMPEMDGLTATRYIRQMPGMEDIPIVALTANIMRDVLEHALTVGCDGYIEKPIDIDELPDQIYSYLNGK